MRLHKLFNISLLISVVYSHLYDELNLSVGIFKLKQ